MAQPWSAVGVFTLMFGRRQRGLTKVFELEYATRNAVLLFYASLSLA